VHVRQAYGAVKALIPLKGLTVAMDGGE